MIKPSSVKSIIINVITYVELQEKNGINPSQKMVNDYLKNIYHQNPLMFGKAKWPSVAGTFRSMISKAKNNTNSNSGLEDYIKVKNIKGLNILKLKRNTSNNFIFH